MSVRELGLLFDIDCFLIKFIKFINSKLQGDYLFIRIHNVICCFFKWKVTSSFITNL